MSKAEYLTPIEENAESRAMDVDVARAMAGFPPCRRCGCTDLQACEGGCSWTEEDLCSACAVRIRGPAYARSVRGRQVA